MLNISGETNEGLRKEIRINIRKKGKIPLPGV